MRPTYNLGNTTQTDIHGRRDIAIPLPRRYYLIVIMLILLVLLLLNAFVFAIANLTGGVLLTERPKDGIPDMYRVIDERINNPHTFNYLINQEDVCVKRFPDIFIIAVVHSAPANLNRRMAIRETWASHNYYDQTKTVVIFAIGAIQNKSIMASIILENDRYGDIIQEDFIDTYRNLTYKGVMWLRWISTYCPQAQYILKLDDDIFVNIFNLVTHVSILYKRNINQKATVMCLLWYNMKVVRNKENKWYLTYKEWPFEMFPKYCSGSAFILTKDLPSRMAYNADRTKFLWIDDFYMTGLLLSNLNATYISLSSLYVLKQSDLTSHLINGYGIFGHVPSSINQRRKMWNEIIAQRGLTSASDPKFWL